MTNNIKNKKIFDIYQYCLNKILFNRKDLCYELFINPEYKNTPWTF